MLFKNNLYFIESKERTDDGVSYTLRFNAEHPIYKAHFPGDAITPGVCILQTGVELLSDAAGAPVEINRVKNVKFLNILRPDGHTVSARVYRLVREEGTVTAQVDMSNREIPIAKMSLVCQNPAK